MSPRSIPFTSDLAAHHLPPADARALRSMAGWRRKAFAMTLHAGGLGLFGMTVVWPVLGPIARGELARDFAPVLAAWAAWLR